MTTPPTKPGAPTKEVSAYRTRQSALAQRSRTNRLRLYLACAGIIALCYAGTEHNRPRGALAGIMPLIVVQTALGLLQIALVGVAGRAPRIAAGLGLGAFVAQALCEVLYADRLPGNLWVTALFRLGVLVALIGAVRESGRSDRWLRAQPVETEDEP